MVLLLTNFCEIEPLSSRIFLAELKWASLGALVFFWREGQQRSLPCLYVWIWCCLLVHDFIHPRTTEGTRICLQLALAETNLVEHRITTTASKLTQQDEGTKLSHQVNLLFISVLIHGLLCFLGLHIILRELDPILKSMVH